MIIMTNLISFPFRVNPNGEVATVEDGTDDYYAEELAVLVLTKPGERTLVPEFGLTDPAFGNFDEEELEAKIELFGPPIRMTSVELELLNPTQEAIRIGFERLEDDGDTDYEEDDFFESEEVTDG